MLHFRSLVFNVAFYAWTTGLTLATLPFYFFVSQDRAMGVVRLWTRGALWLLRTISGTTYEVRGLDNLPQGGALIACKHQSSWETLALVPILPNPTYVMKEELARIPVFGAYTTKAGMIHVDREGQDGGAAGRWPSARARRSPRAARSSCFPRARAGRRAPRPTTRPASRCSTRRWACRWCRRRSIPASTGRGASSPTTPARSSWNSSPPSPPASIRGASSPASNRPSRPPPTG